MLIEDILKVLPHDRFVGNTQQVINRAVSLAKDNSSEDVISWCSDKKIELLKEFQKGTVVCGLSVGVDSMKPGCNYILTDNPRRAFQTILEKFFAPPPVEYVVSSTAQINSAAKLGKFVRIEHNVVIENDVEIGENVIVGHNTVIRRGTVIRGGVCIGANCTIGGIGFGYEKDETGKFVLIPHIGNVLIEEGVEIGNNTAIDRAVMGSTTIGRNAKIDNLVHISHGVKVGENSLVIANAMVAGSVVIGPNVWIAPSASILNQKKIGAGAVVGMGAVVLRDVLENETVVGNPARPLQKR